ncbi:sensor histidine kinase [Allorhizocola rhizosphaerae]|uniref:sensor histidine kinase n=1 Tax=Allorhizocola rhizosphaerae TaxID=1872709 RepID=UPI000E3E1244|nr:histidine kinase [Allorhizocola rhizosphaerae]
MARHWEASGDLGVRFAPRLAKTIVWVVFTCFFVLGCLYLVTADMPLWQDALSALDMFALYCFQLVLAGRHAWRFRQTRLGYLCLAAQAVLGFGPMLLLQDQWLGLPHFVAGSALLILRPYWNWVGFAVTVAAVGVVEVAMAGPTDNMFYLLPYSMISIIVTGIIVYGMSTLSSVVTAMDAARTELAKMAVAQERLRFARDLHDLLGYSLSAISMKTELTHRLVTKNPVRAEEELTQIIEISRQALSDVRSVASGYRELSLDDEAVSARSVLSAADVDVRMDISHHDLPTPVRTVLATVLREGVTNILRHSKAERCDITLRQTDTDVTIIITNDGVSHEPPTQVSEGGGSGIRNLSNRVANLDGTLTTSTDPDGRFRLRATIPTGRVHSQADA